MTDPDDIKRRMAVHLHGIANVLKELRDVDDQQLLIYHVSMVAEGRQVTCISHLAAQAPAPIIKQLERELGLE